MHSGCKSWDEACVVTVLYRCGALDLWVGISSVGAPVVARRGVRVGRVGRDFSSRSKNKSKEVLVVTVRGIMAFVVISSSL